MKTEKKDHSESVDAKLIIFEPNGDRDMMIEYPELLKISEFVALKNKHEVRLCWLIGNRTSPLFKLDRIDKIRQAMETVYGGMERIDRDPELKAMYAFENDTQSIPTRIFSGIERMTWFDPDNRLKAKFLSQYMFDTLNELVMIDRSKIGAMEMDDKKKYADLMIKVNSELPVMVRSLESDYGVKIINKKTNKEVLVNINSLK